MNMDSKHCCKQPYFSQFNMNGGGCVKVFFKKINLGTHDFKERSTDDRPMIIRVQ